MFVLRCNHAWKCCWHQRCKVLENSVTRLDTSPVCAKRMHLNSGQDFTTTSLHLKRTESFVLQRCLECKLVDCDCAVVHQVWLTHNQAGNHTYCSDSLHSQAAYHTLMECFLPGHMDVLCRCVGGGGRRELDLTTGRSTLGAKLTSHKVRPRSLQLGQTKELQSSETVYQPGWLEGGAQCLWNSRPLIQC